MEDYKHRVNSAANFCVNILKDSCTNENNQIDAGRLILTAATFTGIATAVAAQDKEFQMEILSTCSDTMPLFSTSTEMGTFWFGEALNVILFENPMSTWGLCTSFYENNGYGNKIPDIHQLMKEQMAKIGDPNARLWDGQINPYKEVIEAKHAYKSICSALEEIHISSPELQLAFSFSLLQCIGDTLAAFPPEVNVLELVMEAVFFYAHMDI